MNSVEVSPPPTERRDGAIGLPGATALVVGSIIGVGIFNLPGALGSYGPIALVAMAVTTVGALALAVMYAAMSRRMPALGGPYAYARAAFGNGTGFANAWSYWITAWSGNAAIVVGWVLYVQHFVNTGGAKLGSIAIALVGLWVPAVINLAGVAWMGVVQLWTSVLKFVPLALMSTAGLLSVSTGNLHPFNASGGSAVGAVLGAMALCLFSYLGVETASVATGAVRDPDRNVGRATVLGTLATAVVYLLSLLAVFGTLPAKALAESGAPYSDAATAMVGHSWAGDLVAAAVIISGFGALNGWTMICAEMPLAAARDGLFPSAFGVVSPRGVPVFGIIASTVLASVATIVSYAGSAGYQVFNTLVYMSGITAAVPYAFSALAQIRWSLADRRIAPSARFVPDLVVAVVGVVFSALFIWYSRNTGHPWLEEWAPFLMAGAAGLLAVPVYLRQRPHMTPPPPLPQRSGDTADPAPAHP